MAIFKHHPDGFILIDGLTLPLEDFLLDEPSYELPDGYIGREYAPGEPGVPDARHFLHTHNRADSQPLAWPEGDAYIAKVEVYRANYEARHAPPPVVDVDTDRAQLAADGVDAATLTITCEDETATVVALGVFTTGGAQIGTSFDVALVNGAGTKSITIAVLGVYVYRVTGENFTAGRSATVEGV